MVAASFSPDALRAADAAAVDRFVIWPHRSASRRCRALVVSATAVVFGCVAARAAIFGAWPQVIYLLLAVAGLALALSANSRSARMAQVIELLPDRIVVRQMGPAAMQSTLGAFDPCWVRVEEENDSWDEKHVVLRQSDRSITIGEFLPSGERTELAAQLRRRIAEVYAPSPPSRADRRHS